MKIRNLLTLVAVGSVALGEEIIKVGDPVSRVFAVIGKPSGTATKDGITYYMYDGGDVVVKNGKVIDFPKDFKVAAQRTQRDSEIAQQQKIKEAQFEAEQKAKGLVLYKNQWITPEQKGKAEADALIANKGTGQQSLAAKEDRLETAAADKRVAFLQGGLRYKNIVLSPQEYARNDFTLRGELSSLNAEKREFSIEQGGCKIDVSYLYLTKEQQEKILAQKNSSAVLVEVKGTLRCRYDSQGRESQYYYIKAKSVAFY